MQRLLMYLQVICLPASASSPSLLLRATRDESPSARQVKHQRDIASTLESAANGHLISGLDVNDGLRRGA